MHPPTAIQIRGGAGRDQPREQRARIRGHHRQHRQLLGGAGLPKPHRHHNVGEPEVILRDLARDISRPRSRIRRQIGRPQLGDTHLEHRQPTRPADPLRDHRRRHRRKDPQQLTNTRLNLIHDRPDRRPLVLRCIIPGNRGTHRVTRNSQRPRDHLDRQPLRSMQPADLSPVLH